MAEKSTKQETNRRTEEVANLLVAGQTRANIIQYVAENVWRISERQIDNYIKKAKEKLSSEAAETKEYRDVEFTKSLRRMNTIFGKCMLIQDYSRALAAQKEINSLLALYEPQTQHIDHTSKGEKIDSLTEDGKLERVADLLDAARARRTNDTSR